jgi:hypothetical protein
MSIAKGTAVVFACYAGFRLDPGRLRVFGRRGALGASRIRALGVLVRVIGDRPTGFIAQGEHAVQLEPGEVARRPVP